MLEEIRLGRQAASSYAGSRCPSMTSTVVVAVQRRGSTSDVTATRSRDAVSVQLAGNGAECSGPVRARASGADGHLGEGDDLADAEEANHCAGGGMTRPGPGSQSAWAKNQEPVSALTR